MIKKVCTSIFARYVLVSAAFWAVALFVFDGTAAFDGGVTIHLPWLGAVVNLLLLLWLGRGSEGARTALVLEGGAVTILLGFGGMFLGPQPLCLLAFVSGYQIVLLWLLGREWRGEERVNVKLLSR